MIKDALIESVDGNVYFFPREFDGELLDIAFIVIKPTDFVPFNNIDVLEIYNAYDNDQPGAKNVAAGYPSHVGNNKADEVIIESYNVQPNSMNEDYLSEKVIHPDGSLNFYDGDFIGKLQGMSGGGIFTIGKNAKLALRSIVFAANPPNGFECVRVDTVFDSINERIKKINDGFPRIEFSSKILLENEIIDLDEIAEYSYFRNIISKNSNLDVSSIGNIDDIYRESKELDKIFRKSKSDISDLSYKYAHLAVLASERGMRLATTLYFKKAIDLNPEHTVGLLTEKAERESRADLLKGLTPKNILDLQRKYTELLKSTSGPTEKIRVIKEALKESLSIKGDKSEKDRFRMAFFSLLDKEVESDNTLKSFYKYKDLAGFYLFNLQEFGKAFYYYKLASFLLQKSIGGSPSAEDKDEISKKIEFLEKNIKLEDLDLSLIEEAADLIIKSEEGESIKQLLERILNELSHIKSTNVGRDDALNSLLQDSFLNQIRVNEQIIQAKENKIDVTNLHAVVGDFDALTNDFKGKSRSIYELINNSLADIQGEIDKLSSVSKIADSVNIAIDSISDRDLSVISEIKSVAVEIGSSEKRMMELLSSMSVGDDARGKIQASISDAIINLTNALEGAKDLSEDFPVGDNSFFDAIEEIKNNISRFERNFYDLAQKTQGLTKNSQEATERVESAIYSLFAKRRKPFWEKIIYAAYFIALAVVIYMVVISYVN